VNLMRFSEKKQVMYSLAGEALATREIQQQVAIRLRSGQALHFATLRSEVVTFLISLMVCGRKA